MLTGPHSARSCRHGVSCLHSAGWDSLVQRTVDAAADETCLHCTRKYLISRGCHVR